VLRTVPYIATHCALNQRGEHWRAHGCVAPSIGIARRLRKGPRVWGIDVRDSAGFRLFRTIGLNPTDSLQRQIDDAYHQMMISTEEDEQLLYMLKLKRLCSEQKAIQQAALV
jgi:hypothetical protein